MMKNELARAKTVPEVFLKKILVFLVPEKLLSAISGQKKITTVHEGVKFSKPEMKYFWQFSGEKLPILVGRKYFLVLFLVKEK